MKRNSRGRERGQALVLGALSFLVLALMTTLSFNLSHALREKMSLQQHSDSLAYSMAVVEARALNYYAVSNRSIAATYVASNSMHAYMAAASVTGAIMSTAKINFYVIAAQEFAQCGCWSCFMHCVHAVQALGVAGDYSQAASDYEDRARNLDGDFSRAVKGLDRMADFIHSSQAMVHKNTLQALNDGQSYGLNKLKEYNAPGSSALVSGVGALNAGEFNCAVDGMNCTGGVSNSSEKTRAQVMTEVANASRSTWPANRGLEGNLPTHLHPSFLNEVRNIPGEGVNFPLPQHKGTAKTVQSAGGVNGGSGGGNEGQVIAAEESGIMANQWKHGAFAWSYEAKVSSDNGGGDHTPGGSHSGNHEFEGVNTKGLTACTMAGNCFMKFRADDNKNNDFGQPSAYSYVTDDLREGNVKKAPWELNSSASVNFENGDSSAHITLAAGQAAALSKALVYYHRLGEGGWNEAPNLFNPYWRAKLHPFTQEEANRVLTAANATDAAQLVQSAPGLSL